MKELICEGCGDTFTLSFNDSTKETLCEQCRKDL